jgi:hypothetical protein
MYPTVLLPLSYAGALFFQLPKKPECSSSSEADLLVAVAPQLTYLEHVLATGILCAMHKPAHTIGKSSYKVSNSTFGYVSGREGNAKSITIS